mmetsp:Transcript_13228/g.43601  ORF Transcript_13228/g.43601 Transcript_13228/m.43601 type:complete len:135 (+) Transcript_13228:27-431(+)
MQAQLRGTVVVARPQRRSRAAPRAAVAPRAEEATLEKIRVKLRAYMVPELTESVAKITEAGEKTGADVSGPVYLPTKRRRYTVLTSPHVNKDAREQFEIRTHQRLLDIRKPSAQTIDALMQLDLPAGVDIEVRL